MPKGDETKRDYEILGLENSATEEDVRRSFMKLALKFHPDLHARPLSDDLSKSKYHEVCQAFKRIVTGDRSVSEWNSDKSDEIFFSLLREILQATLKSGSLYSMFSSLPNHKTNFQDDNEYRCQEDALEDESEETDFNKLLDILMNRIQNGKSVPAGLTKEKIFKLKEEFIKQKDANKKLAAEKGAAATKKPNKIPQVPVTKPKPKTKKQLLAEQRRREKEMAKIAAELEEKKKKESEKDNMKKQLEAEKQRKLDEEIKKQEEERKKEFQEAKKKKEREDREKEARLQKERDRQEKLRKQQEEEQRRKEEEKKRKAEEKAAKAKSIKEAKDKEEKEKAEQAKKAQQAKRQQQYQQYQQQQQKYPREVPPRFLRQQQMKQQQGLSQSQEQLAETGVVKQGNTQFQGVKKKDVSDFHATSISTSDSKSELNEFPSSSWTEADSTSGELWGQEVTKDNETESSWGGVPVTEDWDTPPPELPSKDTSSSLSSLSELTSRPRLSEDVRPLEPSPIGSELRQGKINKREDMDKLNDVIAPVSCTRGGGFGAVGERVGVTPSSSAPPTDSRLNGNVNKSTTLEHNSLKQVENGGKTHVCLSDYVVVTSSETPSLSTSNPISKPDSNVVDSSTRDAWSKAPGRPKPSVNPSGVSMKQASTGPKLTDWSGLDAFEPVSTTLPNNDLVEKNMSDTIVHNMKSIPVNNGSNPGDRTTQTNQCHSNVPQLHSNPQEPHSHRALSTNDTGKEGVFANHRGERSAKPSVGDSVEQLSNFDIPRTDLDTSRKGPSLPGAAGEEEDEYGWTTASRKAKKNPPVTTSSPKDSNVWVSRSLKQLLDMGFQRDDAERALKENNGIIESAVSDLLAGCDSKSSEVKSSSKSAIGEKTESGKLFSGDTMQSSNLASQGMTTTGQPKLNRKQRRKLMQQQEQLNSKSHGDSSGEGEWKLVTREKNVSHGSNSSYSEPTSTRQIPKNEHLLPKPSVPTNGKTELTRSSNAVSSSTNQTQTVSTLRPGTHNSSFKPSIGSELSKSLPVLSDGIQPKPVTDSSQTGNHSASCSASPRSSGSQSPSLNYHSHLLQTNILNNLPFKSLSTDRLPQNMSSNSPMSTASHLFYSDPQLLPEQSSSQSSQLRNINQSLLKGAPTVDASSLNSQNSIGSSPFSLMHILNPQPSIVNSVVGKPSDSGKADYTLAQDSLQKSLKHIGSDSGQLPPLGHQQPPPGPSPFHNPLPYTNAPQQSKLHQWKQPITTDHQETLDASSSRLQGSSQSIDQPLSNASGAINVPVTVDPVSAKWGVVAAPRLSPTPSEFKPGVPWKPRSELEREAREKSQDSDKDFSHPSAPSSGTLSPAEPSHVEASTTSSESSTQLPDPKSSKSVDSAPTQLGESKRPPPGLSDSYAFPNVSVKGSGNMLKSEIPVEDISQSATWILLKGFSDKVDVSSLKSLCQKYGAVTDFQMGNGCISVCFETTKQATDASKVFNGKLIFDSHFTADVVSEETVLSLIPAKNWNRTRESSTPPIDPLMNVNQRMAGVWVGPTQVNPDPACVMGPTGIGRPIPVNMFGMAPPMTQWSGLATDPTRPPGPFWPLQPGPFIPQVPLGPISLPTQPVTGTGSVVSPSMTKFLPDGLFNGSEST